MQLNFGDFIRKIQLRREPPKNRPTVRKPLNNNSRAGMGTKPTASASPYSSAKQPKVNGPPTSSNIKVRAVLAALNRFMANDHVNQIRSMFNQIQSLRSQSVPVKLLVVGAVAMALNVPSLRSMERAYRKIRCTGRICIWGGGDCAFGTLGL